jgi:hypothetical protein
VARPPDVKDRGEAAGAVCYRSPRIPAREGRPDGREVIKKPSSAVWVITAASLAYATLRYNVLKGVTIGRISAPSSVIT